MVAGEAALYQSRASSSCSAGRPLQPGAPCGAVQPWKSPRCSKWMWPAGGAPSRSCSRGEGWASCRLCGCAGAAPEEWAPWYRHVLEQFGKDNIPRYGPKLEQCLKNRSLWEVHGISSERMASMGGTPCAAGADRREAAEMGELQTDCRTPFPAPLCYLEGGGRRRMELRCF